MKKALKSFIKKGKVKKRKLLVFYDINDWETMVINETQAKKLLNLLKTKGKK